MTAGGGFGALLRAGGRAVRDHLGTVLALYLVQTLLATGAWLVMVQLLADAFARHPLFDRGVDGDLLALVEALRDARATVSALGWLGAGAALLWAVLSWFLAGGLLTVLAERPGERRDAARAFGAGGAAHFLPFARLFVLTIPLYVLVTTVLGLGLGMVAPSIDRALTPGHALGLLLLGLAPAALCLLVTWTVVDLARAELVVRAAAGPSPGALPALVRAVAITARRPAALLLTLAWALAFAAITLGYAWAAHGHAMLGAGGAFTLWIVRQGVLLARLGCRVALVGGQLALVERLAAPATPPADAAPPPPPPPPPADATPRPA